MLRFLFSFMFVWALSCGTAHADDTGGNGGGTNNQQTNNQQNNQNGPTAEQIAAWKRDSEELEKLKTNNNKNDKKDGGGKDDDNLVDRVRKQKQTDEEAQKASKNLEKAITFNLELANFVKTNGDLLPSEITDIVKASEKEKYSDATEKANCVKAAILQSFFTIQANVDSLTPSQKTQVDDYLKLTKTGKEQKASEIYENIFEPALHMVRTTKKAEEVRRSSQGLANSTDSEKAFVEKLQRGARRTYLNEKEA